MKTNIFYSPLLLLFELGNYSKKHLSDSHLFKPVFKCFLMLFIFLQFVNSDVLAQNFFPLKVGNAYQIKDDWWEHGPGGGWSGTNYYPLVVIRDTIINGETFFEFSSNNANPSFTFNSLHFFRYDSLNQKLFIQNYNDTTTRLAVDYNLPAGNNYSSYITGSEMTFLSEGISSEVVLSDTHFVYSMNHTAIPRHLFQFASDIGFVKYIYYWTDGWNIATQSTNSVISAIIDSVIYNPLILSIDTLYPIQDRPVDTFPFLLTIPYTVSYSALVDLFYLDVEHFRSDTLVQIKNFNLSKSNPSHLTFNLDGLQVGDKINLRATITDTSIFYNVAHYPDSGWIVMNVLPPILNVENNNLPLYFELVQNYPNPFNPITRIRYQLPGPTFVIINVCDVLGNEIETLVNEEKPAGTYEIEFDGSRLTSGIYYYRIKAGNFSQTKKMILLK